MPITRKKICLLFCSSLPDLKKGDFNEWLSSMPEASIIADVVPHFIFGGNAADVTVATWLKLVNEIKAKYNQYDGFIILHGLDNILFTASAISFLIQNLGKPIVFTGSQIQDKKRQGLRANLINAIQVACTDNLGEVCLMFGNRLLRANQSFVLNDESLNVFSAPENGVLGRIDFSIRIFDKFLGKKSAKAKFFDELNTNIELVILSPALEPKILAKSIAGRDGVIVNAADYQNLPEDLIAVFEKITANTSIAIWTKKMSQAVIAPKNIFIVSDMIWPAALTKFMWLLAQTKNPKKIKELMDQDIAGEIIF